MIWVSFGLALLAFAIAAFGDFAGWLFRRLSLDGDDIE